MLGKRVGMGPDESVRGFCAGYENRTRVYCLGSSHSATKLILHKAPDRSDATELIPQFFKYYGMIAK